MAEDYFPLMGEKELNPQMESIKKLINRKVAYKSHNHRFECKRSVLKTGDITIARSLNEYRKYYTDGR